jgi:mono/diheme cytochrome c family protein
MGNKLCALCFVGAMAITASHSAAAADNPPYQVEEGHKVDAATLSGWRTWRALACERCHGAQQEGAVGPSLIESLRRLSKEEFEQTVLKGRPEKGMPNFNASKMLNDNLEGLYSYLKGRSDGAIQPGRLEPLQGDARQAGGSH